MIRINVSKKNDKRKRLESTYHLNFGLANAMENHHIFSVALSVSYEIMYISKKKEQNFINMYDIIHITKLVHEANNERFNIDKQNQHLATFFFLKHYNVIVKYLLS